MVHADKYSSKNHRCGMEVRFSKLIRILCILQPRVIGYQLHDFTSTWRWRQQGPPKHWYPTTTVHGITTQKTLTSFPINNDKGGHHNTW